MSTTIQIKRSSTASGVPLSTDLAVGELAVNLADKRLFTKQSDGTIIELSTNPTDLDAATLRIDGVEITASAAELNKLDGFTGSTAELNLLDGLTATTIELNTLDGITASTAELNKLDGYTGSTAELNILDGITATTAEINKLDGFTGTVDDLNYAKDLRATGVTTAELDVLDGITASTAELNITDGLTATTAELNVLDGITSTTAELNILDGVTADATEINVLDGITATTTELNYTDGVTSNIQTQLDAMVEKAGDTMTGDLSLGDNVKAKFGAGNDLEIYHSGSNSFIKDVGQGNLLLDTNGSLAGFTSDGVSKYMALFNKDASVDLFYNNSKKLATTSTGVDVTGTLSADGLTVDGAYPEITINDTRSTNTWADGDVLGQITFKTDDAGMTNPISAIKAVHNRAGSSHSANDAGLEFYTSATTTGTIAKRVEIEATSGDVLFYEDTGTTAKMVWSSSAESLGIGTSSPQTPIEISGLKNTSAIRLRSTTNDASWSEGDYFGRLEFWSNDGSGAGAGAKGSIVSATTGGSGGTNYMAFSVASTATNDIERMRIDASGNVGIGTSSPERPLHIASATPYIVFDETDASQKFSMGSGGGKFFLYDETDSAQRLTVDTSGNVGIGTDSPSLPLDVHGGTIGVTSTSSFAGLQITSANNSFAYVNFGDSDDGNIGQINYNHTDNAMSFKTNNTERARLDSSGNLLVGKTALDSATDGVQLVPDGISAIARSSGEALRLTRNDNDGEILRFQKDGSTVGSIGVADGIYLKLDTSYSGLFFDNAKILPTANGSLSDNGQDLGRSATRFKDLYLSGGVYLGGTGAANKLDDYEEGSWTPTGYTGGTVLAPTYTKVGNLVTISVYFYNGTFDSSVIGGLPFAATTNKFEAVSLANYDATNVNNAFVSQTAINFKNGSSDATPNASKMMVKVTYQTSA